MDSEEEQYLQSTGKSPEWDSIFQSDEEDVPSPKQSTFISANNSTIFQMRDMLTDLTLQERITFWQRFTSVSKSKYILPMVQAGEHSQYKENLGTMVVPTTLMRQFEKEQVLQFFALFNNAINEGLEAIQIFNVMLSDKPAIQSTITDPIKDLEQQFANMESPHKKRAADAPPTPPPPLSLKRHCTYSNENNIIDTLQDLEPPNDMSNTDSSILPSAGTHPSPDEIMSQHSVFHPDADSILYRQLARNFKPQTQDRRMLFLPSSLRSPEYVCPSTNINTKYKHFLVAGPGLRSTFKEETACAITVMSRLEKMCIMGIHELDNDVTLSTGTDISEATLLLFQVDRKSKYDTVLKDIADNILPNISSQTTREHFIALPLTPKGYDEYMRLINEMTVKMFVGNVDVKTRTRLKLDDECVKQSFMKLVDHLDQEGVSCSSDIIHLFDKMTPLHPLYDILAHLKGHASAMKSNVDIANWYLRERRTYIPATMREKAHLLPAMTINYIYEAFTQQQEAWAAQGINERYVTVPFDFEIQEHNSWFETNILNAQTTTEKILLSQGIQPISFINCFLEAQLHGTRRERLMIFYSEQKKCGKSIVADAIRRLCIGKRLTLDQRDGRDFMIGSVAFSGNVIIEDPSKSALLYMDRCLRAHFDGDKVPINVKNQPITDRPFPPVIITTNERAAIDLLGSRGQAFIFRKTMSQIFGTKQVDRIDPSDVAFMLMKYSCFPMCFPIYDVVKKLKPIGPIACVRDAPNGHNPFCRFMRYIDRVSRKAEPLKSTVTIPLPNGKMGLCHLHSYERLRVKNIGWMLSKTALDAARDYILHRLTKHRPPNDEIERLTDIAKRFVDGLARPLSFLQSRVHSDYDHHFITEEYFHPWLTTDTFTSDSNGLEPFIDERARSLQPTALRLSPAEEELLYSADIEQRKRFINNPLDALRKKALDAKVLDWYTVLSGQMQLRFRDTPPVTRREDEDCFG
ncbi:EO1 [Rhynchobatus djiddensis adomavirus 1]|uniref:EO1 n=1 Tax=Rhynchobatus djiddensis adomavirus 1 TaxID=2175117 RepID=A0A2S1MK29_9VIRU|nr:EO1 [Rhynchobatus djiddensis adomavirus 1]AWG87402.1 EO1 [Rhynchobatus djiddensis adomavirus 1]